MAHDPEIRHLLNELARRSGLTSGDLTGAGGGVARFELGEVLGQGGNGIVVRAHDPTLKRDVALKALLPEHASADAARRLLFEARITARLAHPGIIPVHEAGTLPDGRACYAMRMVTGRDLGSLLDALRAGDPEAERAWPLPRLLRVFVQVCHVVAYAHARDVVHRDLKPSNVMLGAYGEVYLGDWGLAKDLRRSETMDAEELVTITAAGVTMGTPPYIAPEQARGQVARVGPPADVYALGVVLYELLTLERPFDARTPTERIVRALTEVAPDPCLVAPERSVPVELGAVALEAMVREPEERALTAAELAERINVFLDGVEAKARRRAEAAEHRAEAQGLVRAYGAAQAALAEEAGALAARAGALPVDAPVLDREAVWRAEQALAERRLDAERVYARAVQVASRSLELDPAPQTHDLLADLHWIQARQAEARGDAAAVLYLQSLVQAHDEAGGGRFAERLAGHGEAEVIVDGAGATVRWERHAPMGPVFEAVPGPEGPGPHLLPVGSWVAEIRAPDRLPVRVPMVIRGDAPAVRHVTPPPIFPGHEAVVPVLGGRVALGGDPLAPGGRPRFEAEVGPFLIGRHPVTMAAYVTYLNALAVSDPEGARARAPRSPDGSQIWLDFNPDARRFSIPRADQDGDRWEPDWPALMIAWHDASAYCAWRAGRDGLAWRLPTELEWEAAARGVDGRAFPWGDGFDPTLCCNAVGTRGKPMPRPVGSFPRDRSPYGVMDMAGLTMEWTATPDAERSGRYILRGGGHNASAEWCRAAARRHHHAGWTGVQFGFRLALDWL